MSHKQKCSHYHPDYDIVQVMRFYYYNEKGAQGIFAFATTTKNPFTISYICVSEEEEGKQYCVWKTLVQSKLQKYAMSQDPICILSASVTVFQNHQKMSPLNFKTKLFFRV